MPRLWNDTIDAHRQTVREAVLDATAALVEGQGLASVTMSRIAVDTGIGRATLYKYFPDIDAVLLAWHERQVGRHLAEVQGIRDLPGTPGERLEAAFAAYADSLSGAGEAPIEAALHRGAHVAHARMHLADLLAELIAAAQGAGDVRTDIPAAELAAYAMNALAAAGQVTAKDAIGRLVAVTLDGLRAR